MGDLSDGEMNLVFISTSLVLILFVCLFGVSKVSSNLVWLSPRKPLFALEKLFSKKKKKTLQNGKSSHKIPLEITHVATKHTHARTHAHTSQNTEKTGKLDEVNQGEIYLTFFCSSKDSSSSSSSSALCH